MRKKMPPALSTTHSSEMIELFKDSCDKLATFINDANHGVSFLPGSLPVTYFGRLTHPDLRVLTVGLNPASSEFDNDAIVGRSGPGHMVASLKGCTEAEAQSALTCQDKYFSTMRARQRPSVYFKQVEAFLNLLGASFYESEEHTLAAHVDVLSPFAINEDPPINKASETALEDGWKRFVPVVKAASKACLMIVIGSGKSSLSKYGDVRWTRHRHFSSTDLFLGRALRVVGESSWGGQGHTLLDGPLKDPEILRELRELLAMWNITLGARSRPSKGPSSSTARLRTPSSRVPSRGWPGRGCPGVPSSSR